MCIANSVILIEIQQLTLKYRPMQSYYRKIVTGLSLESGNTPAKLEVHIFVILELLLAFNVQKIVGSRHPDHAHFLETFVRVMSGLSCWDYHWEHACQI